MKTPEMDDNDSEEGLLRRVRFWGLFNRVLVFSSSTFGSYAFLGTLMRRFPSNCGLTVE